MHIAALLSLSKGSWRLSDQKLNVVHKQVRRDVHYGQDGQPEQNGYHDRHDHHGRHGRHGHQGHHVISIRVCVFIK